VVVITLRIVDIYLWFKFLLHAHVRTFSTAKATRQAPGLIQFPINGYRVPFLLWVKRPGRETKHLTLSNAGIPSFHDMLSWYPNLPLLPIYVKLRSDFRNFPPRATDTFVSKVFLYSRCLTKPSKYISLFTQHELKAIFEFLMVVTEKWRRLPLEATFAGKILQTFRKKRTVSIFSVEDTVLSYTTLVSTRPWGYITEDYILK
jgi:hypothetical protein